MDPRIPEIFAKRVGNYFSFASFSELPSRISLSNVFTSPPSRGRYCDIVGQTCSLTQPSGSDRKIIFDFFGTIIHDFFYFRYFWFFFEGTPKVCSFDSSSNFSRGAHHLKFKSTFASSKKFSKEFEFFSFFRDDYPRFFFLPIFGILGFFQKFLEFSKISTNFSKLEKISRFSRFPQIFPDFLNFSNFSGIFSFLWFFTKFSQFSQIFPDFPNFPKFSRFSKILQIFHMFSKVFSFLGFFTNFLNFSQFSPIFPMINILNSLFVWSNFSTTTTWVL